MKVTMNVECTPEEARAFLGLPDVTMLNEMMVAKVAAQAESNMDAMNPTELMNTWMKFGGMMREQFMEAMTTAAASASKRDDD
ncbi:MAG: DUF6489 family protein [Maricaulaceae bacterium]|jgi:hypothetical protein